MLNADGMLTRLPAELRQLNQWAVNAGPANATSSDKQGKRPQVWNGYSLVNASVVELDKWMPFGTAANIAGTYGLNLGFLLTEQDPYIVIDLDVVDAETQTAKGVTIDPLKWTTKEEFDTFWRIAQAMSSYTERSRSGKGLHIFIRGKLPQKGLRKGCIEIYEAERFIICTGSVVINEPIHYRQDVLDLVLEDMQYNAHALAPLTEVEATEDDETIINRAMTAENAEKFISLANGHWEAWNYPSASEADLSLLSMLCYYTKSNEQARRIFRMTKLGQRDKHRKKSYHIDRCIRTTRAKEHDDVVLDLDSITKSAEVRRLIAMQEEAKQSAVMARNLMPPPLTVANTPQAAPQAPPAGLQMLGLEPISQTICDAPTAGLDWPPGRLGSIAQFIYESAPRPIKEVAIIAALGLVAGMFGSRYHISNSGLNLYLILIAQSGVGKEAMHSGLGALCKHVEHLDKYVNFKEYQSGIALNKAVLQDHCFVNVCGEWGHKLTRLAQTEMHDGPLASLRHFMTNIYQKSGPNAYVGGLGYSNKDDDVESSSSSIAYSMIGESTPGKFYRALTESMMEDGFMSRFTCIEYTGERPPLNPAPIMEPSPSMKQAFRECLDQVDNLITEEKHIAVGRTEEASTMFRNFELEADRMVNGTQNESFRQMWSRASLKCMRIAALLAVIDNTGTPIIIEPHVEWALTIVREDIRRMRNRIEGGDIGINDNAREMRILKVIHEYLAKTPPSGYTIPKSIHEASIIPHRFIQQRCQGSAAFSEHKAGFNAAVGATVVNLIQQGYLVEVEKAKLVKDFQFQGKAYRCISLPT